jgi:hypothetical protein
MREIIFHVTFLSDIILNATSNNEGKITPLDFIPGSTFLGIAAHEYDSFGDPFALFHSGKVRFGDATLLFNNKPTYKIPLSYFRPKLGGDVINHHLSKPISGVQYKQIRNGYISDEGDWLDIDYTYSQKSAYERSERRSKEGSMFGYNAIVNHTKWQFSVTISEDLATSEIETLIRTLVGNKKLGKSKSAQYGSVNIEHIQTVESQKAPIVHNEEYYLYANSRLALIDDNGNPTYDLRYLTDDLTPDQIIDHKTQIRISSYTPFNFKRNTKDYQRCIIEKGSVIVLKNLTDLQINSITKGVGAYLSEGFGNLLINPLFLISDNPRCLPVKKNFATFDSVRITDETAQFLSNRRSKRDTINAAASDVQAFIQKHKKKFNTISNAQWGQIRSLCQSATDETISAKVETFISHGQSQKQWEEGKKLLLAAIEGNLSFTKMLAMQMPKVSGEIND